MKKVFTSILRCDFPTHVFCDPITGRNNSFDVKIAADGIIPFPQVVIRIGLVEHILRDDAIRHLKGNVYIAKVPTGILGIGTYPLKIEGCRMADFTAASPADWIKQYREVQIVKPDRGERRVAIVTAKKNAGVSVKLYFGIHKHMHQPYYRATDPFYWDGRMEDIFGDRQGPYTGFLPAAVWQYIQGELPHAGISTSWSGSLIEQLDRCERERLCNGRFTHWKAGLVDVARQKTALGHSRIGFSAFGFFHPLMPLIPGRDIVEQIERHRRIIRESFQAEPSTTLFPPETAFHVRMIPALVAAGVTAVIYDSIHRFRACKEYPYAGISEGMLPPNPADQENPSVNDWIQLNNIWAGSRISPSLLKPEFAKYEHVDGSVHKIIVVPAERYIGNEDARGGFGALQYPSILGQVYDNIIQHNSSDPAHPPFFLLHSDGDNHGGGADSYYHHNTGRLVEWIREDPRFELTTIDDYLERFPPDPAKAVHVEPGAWSGADNGDPQFRKWFSRYDEPYSPDLNSWAVLTAMQNAVHSAIDAQVSTEALFAAQHLNMVAETSCYWYWTGQELWDSQVTQAGNAAHRLLKRTIDSLLASGKDRTPPTIFAPWITPENPGGKTWGQGSLRNADPIGTVHTFMYDISGLRQVALVLRCGGKETRLPMTAHGRYPSRTGAAVSAEYFTCRLPQGIGDIRYYIEAEDTKSNRSTSSLERAFLA
jgi:hypothetical protein